MKCTNCSKHFSCLKKYIIHIEYSHQLSNYYKCPIKNCHRLYNRRDNFKRHMVIKHSEHVKSQQKKYSVESIHHETSSLLTNHVNNDYAKLSDNQGESKQFKFDIKHNTKQFSNILESTVATLTSKLYSNMGFNRTLIQYVIETVISFLKSGILDIVKNLCSHALDNSNSLKDILNSISMMMDILENSFDPLNTEYKRFKYFENSQYFVKPQEQVIGVSDHQKKQNNQKIMMLKNHLSYSVPMRMTLKSFLEIPGVFKTVESYHNKLEQSVAAKDNNNCMTHLLHGSLWQKVRKEFPNNQIVFPLTLYFDDFEALNPLGSHAGCYKIGSVYFSLPSVPPEYASRLENIFLSLIFYSGDRQQFGNKKTFNVIIKELKFLETTGINITTDKGEVVNVKFCLIALTGDNLGVHTLLGFNESFSSNYYCRFCISPKNAMRSETVENREVLRRKENYEEHVAKKLGIKESCLWNKLANFHVYDNLCCDVMHDMFEGVLRYDMALVIFKLTQAKYFTVERLNARIKYFTYSNAEKNICPGINKDHLSDGGCLIMSAAEMLCLTRNFCLIVGELVPEESDVWKFYLIILEITQILTSTAISQSVLELLSSLIIIHNEMYMKISGEHLKPKFHFLVHYPRIISKIGPPILLSCMRFEAKHRDLKSVSQRTSCRKNLPYTLTLRNQLKFCYRLMAKEGLGDQISLGRISDVDPDHLLEFQKNSENFDNFFCATYYEINGVKYDTNSILLYSVCQDIPNFCQIKEIFIDKDDSKNVYFYCLLLKSIDYNEHLYAYSVELTEKFKLIKISCFFSELPTVLHTVKSALYISGLCTG